MSQTSEPRLLLAAIYSLSPLHCGTGATTGAIDLPIARESHTNLPILPASSLKGAARAWLEQSAGRGSLNLTDLFGPELGAGKGEGSLRAGSLSFGEAHLLLYPIRGLSRPFHYVTAPLLIDRLNRELRALGGADRLLPLGVRPESAASTGARAGSAGRSPDDRVTRAYVVSSGLGGKSLVLEDLIYTGDEVQYSETLRDLASALADLLPVEESETRERIRSNLVLIPDEDLLTLLEHVVPVQARIKLSEQKTTSGDDGNLWYEEQLPPDCLFASLIFPRPGISGKNDSRPSSTLSTLQDAWKGCSFIQVGGNETVGQGLCWWTLHDAGGVNQGSSTPSGGGAGGQKAGSSPGAGKGGSITSGPQQAGSRPPTRAAVTTIQPVFSAHTPTRNLERERQDFLFKKLGALKGTGRWREVQAELEGAPVQLRQVGLTVTLATLSRRAGGGTEVVGILNEWVRYKMPVRLLPKDLDGGSLLTSTLQLKSSEYHAVQREVMCVLDEAKMLAKVM